MYATCLYCHAALGANAVVEHLPIGQRVAFDEARGRLWVVCRSCLRWNLTPFDDRLEAIEECERLFRGTRLRFSTDNIGMARAADGTDLVRVGEALRPEMAAWRFGAQLARRRRNYTRLVAGSAVAGVAIIVGLQAAGLGLGTVNVGWRFVQRAHDRLTRLHLPHPQQHEPIVVEFKQAQGARLLVDDPENIALSVRSVDKRIVQYRGNRLRDMAPKILARRNRSGLTKRDEQRAVELLSAASETPAPDLFQALLQRHAARLRSDRSLKEYDDAFVLSLEMALHEDRERVAMAGELLDLETAWREAEELANIADSLVPSSVDRALVALRRKIG